MEARREALLDIYANPTPVYGAPPPAYGSNPYEVTPYQPAYGSSTPYAVVPVSHPQSTTAMVFGILGIVLGLSCGIGGLLGIGGIVQGRQARDEIDAAAGTLRRTLAGRRRYRDRHHRRGDRRARGPSWRSSPVVIARRLATGEFDARRTDRAPR